MAISSERRISKHLKTLPVPVIHPPQPATALPEHSDIFLHNFNPGYFPFLPPWQLHLQHKPPPSPMSLAPLPSIPILISEQRPRPFPLEDNWCNNSWLMQRLLTVLPFNWPFHFHVGKVYWYISPFKQRGRHFSIQRKVSDPLSSQTCLLHSRAVSFSLLGALLLTVCCAAPSHHSDLSDANPGILEVLQWRGQTRLRPFQWTIAHLCNNDDMTDDRPDLSDAEPLYDL